MGGELKGRQGTTANDLCAEDYDQAITTTSVDTKQPTAKDKRNIMRNNVIQVLTKSTVMPFRWLKSSYRCFYCYDIFQEASELKLHQATHVGDEIKIQTMRNYWEPVVYIDVSNLSCTLCPESITDLHDLIDHLIGSHHVDYNKDVGTCMVAFKLDNFNVSCLACGANFYTFGPLLHHTNKDHKGTSAILCDICGQHFKDATLLRLHVKSVHENAIYLCTECGEKFDSKSKLKTHQKNSHDMEKKYKCADCSEVFQSIYKRSQHMASEHKNRPQIKCPHCPKTFVFRSMMMTHLRDSHLKFRNHVCGVCGWKAFNSNRLKNHMYKHSGEKNFKCEACDKAFTTKKIMRAHFARMHKNPQPIMQYENPYAGQVTKETYRRTYRNHLRCVEMSVEERRKDQLTSILSIIIQNSTIMPFRWHSGKYMCFYCCSLFVESSKLKDHTNSIHKEIKITEILIRTLYRGGRTKLDVSNLWCVSCECNFRDFQEYLNHISEVHELQLDKEAAQSFSCFQLEDNGMYCLECGQFFQFFGPLLLHTYKYHIEHFLCDICGQGYVGKHNIHNHVKKIHGVKCCKLCNQIFRTQYALTKHIENVHRTDKLKCDICHEILGNRYLKKRHMALVHDCKDEQFVCEYCSKIFTRYNKFLQHKSRVHFKEKNCTCEVCGYKAFNLDCLKRHMVRHNDARPFTCEICNKTFRRKKNLLSHRRLHKADTANNVFGLSPVSNLRRLISIILEYSTIMPFKWYLNRYRCFYCDHTFVHSSELKQHSRNHIDIKLKDYLLKIGTTSRIKWDVSEISCKLCPKPISNYDDFLHHINKCHDVNIDTEIFYRNSYFFNLSDDAMSCLECDEKFKFFAPLLRHVNKYHNKSKKYICDHCGLAFALKGTIKHHLKNKHSSMPTSCNICGENFTTKISLTVHCRKEHKTGKFACDLCSETFESRYARKNHIAILHNVKSMQYPCEICSKIFTTRSILMKHVSGTHLKEKFATCHICGFKGFDLNGLKRHLATHDREIYKCHICHRKFFKNKNYLAHMDKHSKGQINIIPWDKQKPIKIKMRSQSYSHSCGRNHARVRKVALKSTQWVQELYGPFQYSLLPSLSFSYKESLTMLTRRRNTRNSLTATLEPLKPVLALQTDILASILANLTRIGLWWLSDICAIFARCLSYALDDKGFTAASCLYIIKLPGTLTDLASQQSQHTDDQITESPELLCHLRNCVLRWASSLDLCLQCIHLLHEAFLKVHKSAQYPQEYALLRKCQYKGEIQLLTQEYQDMEEKLTEKQRKDDLTRLITVILENSTILPFRWSANKYMCYFCCCSFIDSSKLKQHTIEEHKDAKLRNLLRTLVSRSRVKLDTSEIICKRCNRQFLSFEEFLDHLSLLHELKFKKELTDCLFTFNLSDDGMSCHECGQEFRFFGPLLKHAHKYHNRYKTYLCEICGQGFVAKANVDSHIRNVHSFSSGQCTKCDKVFRNNYALQIHCEKTHKTEMLKCPKCPEILASKYLKKRHLALAHDDKKLQFNCDECNRVFTMKSRLVQHKLRTHLKQKTVACEICGFKVFNNDLLRRHMVRHNDTRPFECEFCKKTFQRKKTLEVHKRIHTNDRRYMCKECGRAFVQVTSWKLHMRVHHAGIEGASWH
ncbi:hypothetical protein HW555_003905 [Spodoptera exigua]|uniref:C2H2-type domain-containing protein n=1 Tax=Spodoptera exigua TaxID=7107 RepID=A0A835GMS4_SPOEX|nr:hypothetical protein HW555_003905 [Spodoptera exigua]